MLRHSRINAALVAIAVLGWQVGNAVAGRFVHPFLVADLLVAAWLLAASCWPGPIVARVALLSGHGAMLGVLLSAVTGRMLDGHLDAGTIAAAIGLVPCLAGIVWAGRISGDGRSRDA